MSDRVKRHGLNVARALADFIETQALPGTELDAETVWAGLARMVRDLGPRNVELLHHRDRMQIQVDAWHVKTRGHVHDADAYETFLKEIGYLVPEGPDFQIDTANVDPEIAEIPGPQLVVPITNARFALNAANARWGSLYDALYGTDALGDLPTGPGYDSDRGSRVIERAKGFLDDAVPLAGGTWGEVDRLGLDGLLPVIATGDRALSLAGPASYEGHAESNGVLSLLFRHNGLRIELVVDPASRIGRDDPAGLSDIRLESAMSTIMDCEDSVACVDAADKVQAYSNWLGLMKGDLEESFEKAGQPVTRRMKPDRVFTDVHGQPFMVKSCSLLLVRNVGHLMTNPAVLDPQGNEIGEGLMDALCTTLIAMHDLARDDGNSVCGSVYVVKPKMHGPAEVAFAVEIFDMVEDILGLPRNTVKLGIMDEERRTSVNLKECIRAAASRVAFINTGFLDRTGDEIHTAMEAGPMLPKGEMKNTPWIKSYEDRNVDIGLACGLRGRAQIGKGMWAMPDLMADMLDAKIAHPMAGANCAWVPSPTAATLHATHYHRVNVLDRQAEITAGGPRGTLRDLLTVPVITGNGPEPREITREIENNAQGILGYVVRWVDQGVGCSKVPDIHDVGLMEDRATCRISSQALANWLHHEIVDEAQVMAALQKMAAIVDRQNANDPDYEPMAPGFDGVAFQAACDLVFKGRVQPSGYTEPVLHARRIEKKSRAHRRP